MSLVAWGDRLTELASDPFNRPSLIPTLSFIHSQFPSITVIARDQRTYGRRSLDRPRSSLTRSLATGSAVLGSAIEPPVASKPSTQLLCLSDAASAADVRLSSCRAEDWVEGGKVGG